MLVQVSEAPAHEANVQCRDHPNLSRALLPRQCPHNECIQVDFEDSWSATGEGELLEEVGLNERIGLYTLGLFNSHF